MVCSGAGSEGRKQDACSGWSEVADDDENGGTGEGRGAGAGWVLKGRGEGFFWGLQEDT